MSTFELAIPAILMHEGGWVDNPADPGGETNFGISMLMVRREKLTLSELGIPNFNPGSMKFMPVASAKAIYKKYFWDKFGYGQIANQTAATKVFDCAVNCGPGRAGKMAQKAANRLGADLMVDGALGPKSFAAINACDPAAFLQAMAAEMQLYYNAIVANNPTLGVFLRNWTKRAAWVG